MARPKLNTVLVNGVKRDFNDVVYEMYDKMQDGYSILGAAKLLGMNRESFTKRLPPKYKRIFAWVSAMSNGGYRGSPYRDDTCTIIDPLG